MTMDTDEKIHTRKTSSGTFAGMGLAPALLKAITHRGYRQPTPIQRKSIVPLLSGRDVVGMARTGSGKTAAFVLPMLHLLRTHSARVGARGLIISPSRELALQTAAVVRELGKETDLRTAVLVGGEGLEEHFAQLATNPDIIIATPGRLMHIAVESGLSLAAVQFVVWDEADRLMEDGTMAVQMNEICARLSSQRQTALFSATLPSALASFAQASLRDPLLVRLDSEGKLSEDLVSTFLHVAPQCKDALLLLLLDRIASKGAGDRRPLCVVFVATRHHCEYLHELLASGFAMDVAQIHGTMDQVARKNALDDFGRGRKPTLIVTDVAARGLDIPLLDFVINYDFPAIPKLYVHRVGRVARAGRPGTAYSMVTGEEAAYLYDLHLFLNLEGVPTLEDVPQTLLDDEDERIAGRMARDSSLVALKHVVRNACKAYRRTRPAPSPESFRRAKTLLSSSGRKTCALFAGVCTDTGSVQLLQSIGAYKPRGRQGHLELAVPSAVAKRVAAPKTAAANPSWVETQLRAVAESQSQLRMAGEKETRLRMVAEKDGYAIQQHGLDFAEASRALVMDIATKRTAPVTDDLLARGKAPASRQDARNRLLDTGFGTRVKASFRSDAYEKWRGKTHLSIQQPGETECVAATTRAKATLDAGDERRKWRGKQGGVKKSRKAVSK